MSQSISRFILNDDGSIIDIAQRLPPASACKCDRCQQRTVNELNDQVYLRRCVLNAQLAALSEKIEALCEPESHSLAQVIYWTIYVSKLDWTIGQVAMENGSEGSPILPPAASVDRSTIGSFIDGVALLLRDLYGDCDQDLLNDLLEALRVIALQWDRARTASSRGFVERLSTRVNIPVRPLDGAPFVSDGTSATETIGRPLAASTSIGSKG